MKTHFDHLLEHVPDLASRAILDIGSGRGGFIVDAAVRGAAVTGVEPYALYRAETNQRTEKRGVTVEVVSGTAEQLPFPDASFGFINMSEVVEHVEDPRQALIEAYRVLSPGGYGYISVPNRFGFFDPHYHLYGINWMPRSWAEWMLAVVGMTKQSTPETGRQRLSDMHYMTYGQASRLLTSAGFRVHDIRELKLQKRLPLFVRLLALFVYRLGRACYFDTAHLLVHR